MTTKTINLSFSPSGMPTLPLPHSTAITIGVHNVKLAKDILGMRIRGFFVSMPLDWGSGEEKSPKAPVSPAMIAVNDRRTIWKDG